MRVRTTGASSEVLRSSGPRRMSMLDASFLYLERPEQPLHVATILPFEGQLDYGRLVARLDSQIRRIPRYVERAVPTPLGVAHPSWEADPTFDLRAHVHQRQLPWPGTAEQLAALCAELYAEPLDRAKPLWELYVIDGYDRNGSALFAKVHHCMVDGVSGVELLGLLLEESPPVAPRPAKPAMLPRRPSLMRRLVNGVVDRSAAQVARGADLVRLLMAPRRVAQEIAATADALRHCITSLLAGSPHTPLDGRTRGRRLAWCTFGLDEIREIKQKLGGSINDVVLAVTAGALRRLLADRGTDPDGMELRAAVPVNQRPRDEQLELGNRISAMLVPLPVGIDDPVARLRHVHRATTERKQNREAGKLGRMMKLADAFPVPLQQLLLGHAPEQSVPMNTICTNVPGPPCRLSQQGVALDGIVPFVPLAGEMGVAFAALSYAESLTIGVTADAGVLPDGTEVIADLRASYDELRRATGVSRPETAGRQGVVSEAW